MTVKRTLGRVVSVVRPKSLDEDGGFVLFVAFAVASLGNFAFHAAISRLLNPASYGTFSSLMSLLLVLQVPIGAVQVVITHEVASRRGAGLPDASLDRLLKQALTSAAVGLVVTIILIRPIEAFLHISSAGPVFTLGVLVGAVCVGVVPRAVLLGLLRLRLVAVGLILSAIMRILVGVVLVQAGTGVTGAMLATLGSEIGMTALFLFAVRSNIRRAPGQHSISISFTLIVLSLAAFVGLWLMIAIDTLLSRHYLPPAQSGFYAAASTAGTIAFFLPSALAVVLFPRFAEHNGVGSESRQHLVQGGLFVTGLGLATAALIAAVPRVVIRVLFGSTYTVSTSVVGVLAFSAAVAGLVSLLVYYHLARRSAAALIPLGGVALAAVLTYFWHDDMVTIALITMWSFLAIAVVMSLALWEPLPAITGEHAAHPLLSAPDPTLDVTVVVPYYNPGPRFRSNLERVRNALALSGLTYEVIAVSDGSTDGSDVAVQELEGDGLVLVTLPTNQGKGQALRTGLLLGQGRYLGFIDADGDLDPELLLDFLEIMQSNEPDVVLGSKLHPKSVVVYPTVRRLYSWTYQRLIRILFNLKVRDTQTGLKLIRREVVANALPRMLEKRFAFDLELLVVAKRLGYDDFREAPIRINERFTSTISVRAVWRMLIDTLAIFYRLRVLRYYERPGGLPERVEGDASEVEASALTAVLTHENP